MRLSAHYSSVVVGTGGAKTHVATRVAHSAAYDRLPLAITGAVDLVPRECACVYMCVCMLTCSNIHQHCLDAAIACTELQSAHQRGGGDRRSAGDATALGGA